MIYLIENKQMILKILNDNVQNFKNDPDKYYKKGLNVVSLIKEPNLKPLFLFFKLKDKVDINNIYEQYKELKRLNLKLPKPIESYYKKESDDSRKYSEILSDDINNAIQEQKLSKIIKNFPKNVRPFIDDEAVKLIDVIKKLDPKYKGSNKFILINNREQFIETLKNEIELLNTNKQEVLTKISNYPKAKIVYDKHNILIVNIPDIETSRGLGCTDYWCISYLDNRNAWDAYINNNRPNLQFFIWNFNLPVTDYNSIIGVTYDIYKKK